MPSDFKKHRSVQRSHLKANTGFPLGSLLPQGAARMAALDAPVRLAAPVGYRTAEEKDNSLAMCNLGYKLLVAGFFPEARQQVDKAFAIKPVHTRVPELLKRLNETTEEEDKKLNATLDETKDKAAFFRKLGESVLRPTPTDIAPDWKSPECPLQVTMDGTSVKIIGTYPRPANFFAGLGQVGSSSGVTITQRVEYVGEMRGGAIFGRLKRSAGGQASSALEAAGDGILTVMFVNENGTEIAVMERADAVSPAFCVLTRS